MNKNNTNKQPLKKSSSDTAAVNRTRNKIFEIAKEIGLKVQTGSGTLAKLVRVWRSIHSSNF